MRAVIDENVSLALARALREQGWDVEHMAETADRAVSDETVWAKARGTDAVLITRDHHLTNPVRFPPSDVATVLFLRQGNLSSADEVALVMMFIARFDVSTLRGKLVTLSPNQVSVR
jgi:predicted nuclease of predicted toxin-antitoxin system